MLFSRKLRVNRFCCQIERELPYFVDTEVLSLHFLPVLECSSSCHQTQEPNEETGSDDSNDDASNKTKVRIRNEQVGEQSTEKRTTQADNAIPYFSIADNVYQLHCKETYKERKDNSSR